MFRKVTKHDLRKVYSNVKSHLGQGYHHVKSFLHSFDHGVKFAHRLYKSIEQDTKDIIQPDIHRNIKHGFEAYDQLKNLAGNVEHNVQKEVGKASLLNF